MFLLNPTIKKAKLPDKPQPDIPLACPECAGRLIPSANDHFCVNCGKRFTIAQLLLAYNSLIKSGHEQKVKIRSYEIQCQQLEKELTAERKRNHELKCEVSRLREENPCVDPFCIKQDVDRLDKHLTDMETLIHDLLEE